MSKKYRPDAEGAIYDSRVLCTTFEPPPQVNPVEDSQELALEVLRHFYGAGVTLEGKYEQPHLNGERLTYPPLEDPDVIADAFELLHFAHSVNTIEKAIDDPSAEHIKPDLIRALAHNMFKLGQWQQIVWIRWEGFERLASIGKTADGNIAAQRRGKPMPEQAGTMFANGQSIRAVSKASGVGRSIAERWQKEWKEESEN